MTDLSAAGPGPAPAPLAAAAPAAAAPVAAAAAAPPTPAPLVDFDAGGVWGSETITLDYPFKLQGATYTAVTVRTPSGNDVANYFTTDYDRIKFVAALTDLSEFVLRAMHASDFKKVTAAALAFLA